MSTRDSMQPDNGNVCLRIRIRQEKYATLNKSMNSN